MRIKQRLFYKYVGVYMNRDIFLDGECYTINHNQDFKRIRTPKLTDFLLKIKLK